jgi:2'-5' RNA ligase
VHYFIFSSGGKNLLLHKRKTMPESAQNDESSQSNDKEDDYENSKFDHIFSGWSVWIEPEDDDIIDNLMTELQTACGGQASGAASFVPHVTLLYNLPPLLQDENCNSQDRLQACWNEFVNKNDHNNHSTAAAAAASDDDKVLSILPTDWYYFHYPKSADDGKGFGCSIALLLIEPTKWLVSLQETCRKILGPDERNKFIPHLSLVYAPEDRSDYLQGYVETKRADKVLLGNNTTTELVDDMHATHNGGLPIKYLSSWSTQGRIQDWYRIAKIPIS